MKLKQSKLKLTKKSTIIIAASLVLLAALLIYIYPFQPVDLARLQYR